MRFLGNKFVRYLFLAIVFALIVYDFYYVPNTVKHMPEEQIVPSAYYCPDAKFVDTFGAKWSNEYWTENPEATIEDWTFEWNRIARAMNCSIYIFTPEEAQKKLDATGTLP